MLQYKLGFIPTSFVIIGTGGTGGRLVPLLSQFLKTITWIQNLKIFLVDYDVIEEKNLIRQNFIRLDIGKSKAVVLAERYGKAYDVNIIPIVKEVKGGAFVLSETSHVDLGIVKTSLESINNAIIIMCVDSAEARRRILNTLFTGSAKNILIIDAGNENDFGQVQLFNNAYYVTSWKKEDIQALSLPGIGIPFNVDVPNIACPLSFYDDLKDIDTRNCAELDQTLAINATMATSIFGIIQNLVFQKPVPFDKLNVSLSFGSIPEMMTVERLYDKCQGTKSLQNMYVPPLATSLDNMLMGIKLKMNKEFGVKAPVKKKKVIKQVKLTDLGIEGEGEIEVEVGMDEELDILETL